MKNALLLITMMTLLGLSLPSNAAFKTGTDIYQDCTTDEDRYFVQGYCLGYIIGAYDALPRAPKRCAPQRLSAQDLQDVVVNYLRVRPQDRHLPAAGLVEAAIKDAWPCPEPTRRPSSGYERK